MIVTFSALAPTFLVIALGVFLRRWLAQDVSFWRMVERMTYFVLFPSLLIHRLMMTDLPGDEGVPAVLALLLPAITISIFLVVIRTRFSMADRDFPSFLMGSIRFNSYAGLAAANALYGDEGLALFALLLACYMPTVNVISISVLARYGVNDATSLVKVLKAIATNPVILACVIGFGLNLSGIRLPLVLDRTLGILGDAALGFRRSRSAPRSTCRA